jgi:hypothetical protein
MAEPKVRPWTPGEERIGTVAVRVMSWVNTALFPRERRPDRQQVHARCARLPGHDDGRAHGPAPHDPSDLPRRGHECRGRREQGRHEPQPGLVLQPDDHPEAQVQIGTEVRDMVARRASDAEKAALWPRLVAIYPDYADYQARTDRNIPVMILSPRR